MRNEPSDVTKRIRAFAKAERLRDRINGLEYNEKIRRDKFSAKIGALKDEFKDELGSLMNADHSLQPTDDDLKREVYGTQPTDELSDE